MVSRRAHARQREERTLTNRSRRVVVPAAALAFILAFSCIPSVALADTVSDKRAAAAAVSAQIQALDNRVEIAAEAYNKASDRYAKVTAQVDRTNAKLHVLRGHIVRLQVALGSQANRMYRSGPLAFLEVLLAARSFDDFNTAWDVLTDISAGDAANVKSLKSLRTEAESTFRELKNAQADAATQKRAVAQQRSAVQAKLAARKSTYSSIQSDIRSLIAQQEAAQESSARSHLHHVSSGGRVIDVGGNPPSSSKGAQAVWWAEKALGCDYEWGASGPNTFDCSGLTMWAYGHVGVSLPHSSSDQIGCGSRVSRSNLEPGDLVFFGSPIHHVGMYVGGGDFIEAPHTGAVVRIASLDARSDYAGACRP